MASLPDNLPVWAKVGAQWAIVGGGLVYAYFDVRSDVEDFKSLAASMNTNLYSINQRIATLDVQEDRATRMAKDIERIDDRIRALEGWQRTTINRERGAVTPN